MYGFNWVYVGMIVCLWYSLDFFSVFYAIMSVILFNWIVIALLCLNCLHICHNTISLSKFCDTEYKICFCIKAFHLGLVMVSPVLFSVSEVSVPVKDVLFHGLMGCYAL